MVARPGGPGTSAHDRSHETDVVVIGSGLGGLCCAAMLASYGLQVRQTLWTASCASC